MTKNSILDKFGTPVQLRWMLLRTPRLYEAEIPQYLFVYSMAEKWFMTPPIKLVFHGLKKNGVIFVSQSA